MTHPRVLVTGATGLLGPYLLEAGARVASCVEGLSRHGPVRCDLVDRAAVGEAFAGFDPDLVIHAAALTNVDTCERDPEAARRANGDATANIAAALKPSARLVYLSTDQVYPDTVGPHVEDDAAPVNVYGRSKLAGEEYALSRPNSLALRTNLFGPSRSPERESLSDFVVTHLSARKPVKFFVDVLFSPLHMATLASLVLELAATRITGTFNLGCREGASKRDFAHAVAHHLGLPLGSAQDAISDAIPGRALRTKDLRLNVDRIEGVLGRRMPTLAEEIQRL